MSFSNKEVWPPDMEPLPKGHQFYVDLCDLIEAHETDQGYQEDADGDLSRERLLYALDDFQKTWMDTFSATGATWRSEPISNVKKSEEHVNEFPFTVKISSAATPYEEAMVVAILAATFDLVPEDIAGDPHYPEYRFWRREYKEP